MDVRRIDYHDLPQLLSLYRHLNPQDVDTSLEAAKGRVDLLRAYPGSDIFVGCLGEELVASCTLVVIPNITRGGAPYALIENVVTDPRHRNQGYGKGLLKEVTEAAWRAGCYKVMLLTGSQTPSVHNFYLSAGFEQNKTGFQIRRLSSANV